MRRGFSVEEAMEDVVVYLENQSDEYFAAKGTTRSDVLGNSELLEELALEHHKCVYSFGNDREWSVADACDNDPGICKED